MKWSILILGMIMTLLAATTVVADEFWEPFVRGGEFTGVVAVGESGPDVGAALQLILVIQQNAPDSVVGVMQHNEYAGESGIIVTSGDIEPEFANIFSGCGIEAFQYEYITKNCRVDGKDYYLVYASDKEEVIEISGDVAEEEIPVESEVIAMPDQAIPLEELLERQQAAQTEEEQIEEPVKVIEEEPVVEEIVPVEEPVAEPEVVVVQDDEEKGFIQNFFDWVGSWF